MEGTVIVFDARAACPHHTGDWGENGLHWGPFLFFGDKELLMKIANVLDK